MNFQDIIPSFHPLFVKSSAFQLPNIYLLKNQTLLSHVSQLGKTDARQICLQLVDNGHVMVSKSFQNFSRNPFIQTLTNLYVSLLPLKFFLNISLFSSTDNLSVSKIARNVDLSCPMLSLLLCHDSTWCFTNFHL